MPPRFYELRVYRRGKLISDAAFVAAINLDEPVYANDLLTRHLYAAVDRAAADRKHAHEFVLEAYATDRDGKSAGQHLFRFALPVEREVPR